MLIAGCDDRMRISGSVFMPPLALLPPSVFMPSLALLSVVALLLLVMGGCASDSGTDGVDAVVTGEVGASGAGVEEVPKILLGGDAGGAILDADGADVTLDIERIQPGLVLSRPQEGAGAYTAGYEWLDSALVGGTRTLEYYRGTPLVVNFFSARCPPCVREMPEFQRVFSSLGGEVAFLGLSQDPTPEKAFELVQKTGVLYDIGWDPDLEVYKHTGSVVMPTTAFFTAEGEMVEVSVGALTRRGLRDRIGEIYAIASVGSRGIGVDRR